MTTSLLTFLGAFLQLALLIGKILQQRQLIQQEQANGLTELIQQCQRILDEVKVSRAAVHGSAGDEFDLDGPHTTVVADTGHRQDATADSLSKLLSDSVSQPEGQPGHSPPDPEK